MRVSTFGTTYRPGVSNLFISKSYFEKNHCGRELLYYISIIDGPRDRCYILYHLHIYNAVQTFMSKVCIEICGEKNDQGKNLVVPDSARCLNLLS